MANLTFLDLQAALSSMWGFEDPTSLTDRELVDLKTYINTSYFSLYAPIDGTRTAWPVQTFSGFVKAAVNTTLTVTKGSKVVTGYAFESSYFGSFVKIGDTYFQYGAAGLLVQPVPFDSGTYDATVYHNASALPFQMIEVDGMPTLTGIGLLAPLPDNDAELYLRTGPAFDFSPKSVQSPFTSHTRAFSERTFFDTGEPRNYHIDQAGVGADFAIGNRLHLYPVPELDYSFTIRGNTIPAALTADADIPLVPANAVDSILLPICRETLVANSDGRRFTGNAQLIIDAAGRARAQLKSLRRTQRDVAGAFRVRSGW